MVVMEPDVQRARLELAYRLSMESRDPSKRNAALLMGARHVVAWAVNEFPKGVEEHPFRWRQPEKYDYVEHAERNVIYLAASQGIATRGRTMVCPWAACAACARAIIQSGIVELIVHKKAIDDTPGRWQPTVWTGRRMLEEAGVLVTAYDGELDPWGCSVGA